MLVLVLEAVKWISVDRANGVLELQVNIARIASSFDGRRRRRKPQIEENSLPFIPSAPLLLACP